MFLVCDIHCVKSIKERVSWGQNECDVWRSPDMKVRSDFDYFLQNRADKCMLLSNWTINEKAEGKIRIRENIIFKCETLLFER